MDRLTLLQELASEINIIAAPHPIRVAIDGMDTAGKTTLANELGETLQRMGRQIIRASVDGFHNPQSVRHLRGDLSPEGYYLDSFDYDILINQLLKPLGPDGSRHYRLSSFDYLKDVPVVAAEQVAGNEAILLLDGIFLLRPCLLPHWDFSIYLRITKQEALRRAINRDEQQFGGAQRVRERYLRRYFPAHARYMSDCHPLEKVTRVVDNEDPEEPALLNSA